ncbi:pilin [Patescibacteria group bacterium]|jgi:hypothetical protein|nr:pilin [Patescibacteria group bacterium]
MKKNLLLLLPLLVSFVSATSYAYTYQASGNITTQGQNYQSSYRDTTMTLASSQPPSSGTSYSSAENSACSGISQLNLNGSQNCTSGSVSLTKVIRTVIQILSLVLGALAVIMIIVSGIRFATSGGDANSVSAAKKTLIYALIGLVLAFLAQVIVRLTLSTANGVTSSILPIFMSNIFL